MMWAVSDIKSVTSVEYGVGYCTRFALIFVKIRAIFSCVKIPGNVRIPNCAWSGILRQYLSPCLSGISYAGTTGVLT